MPDKKLQSLNTNNPKAEQAPFVASKTNNPKAGQATGIAKAVSAIKEILNKEGEVIKATKTDSGWEIEFEVVEQSEYMKKIGIPKPVYDKNIYYVILDHNFNLLSYERKGQRLNNNQ